MKTSEKIYSIFIFAAIILGVALSGTETKIVDGFIPIALTTMKVLFPVVVVCAVVYFCICISERRRRPSRKTSN